MYYLEDLTIREIKFIQELLEAYKKDNDKPSIPLPPFYHSFRIKLKRLCKFISFNPLEEETPKQHSKYSVWKKERKPKTTAKKFRPLEPSLNDTSVLNYIDIEKNKKRYRKIS
jgi:hypothetical protein